jgi:DNA invertase Pin-like site-specific DNA recombinase
LAERRRRNKPEMAVESDALKPTKHTGGRPALSIDRYEVFDAISEGESISEVARKFNISRGSVYNFLREREEEQGNV